MSKKNKICLNPWNYLVIEGNGECFFCCSFFTLDKYSIGNILEQSIEEIWNGKKAQAFRKDVLENKYTHCDINYCRDCYQRYNTTFTNPPFELTAPLPTVVHYSYDYSCSQKCIFCRDNILCFSKEEANTYNKIIDTKLLPLLANAKIISLTGSGEIFDSNHSKNIVKRIAKEFKHINLEIYSNGIKFTKENMEKLGIENKLKIVHISVNAGSKKVYKKIFGSDNFEKVKNNILYLTELKNQNKIEEIHLNYIINEVNYKDMKNFMKFAEKLNVSISFSITHPSNAKFTAKDEIYAIHKPVHYLYNDFIRKIKDPIFKNKNCNFDFDTNLKPISIFQIIKNYINRYK